MKGNITKIGFISILPFFSILILLLPLAWLTDLLESFFDYILPKLDYWASLCFNDGEKERKGRVK